MGCGPGGCPPSAAVICQFFGSCLEAKVSGYLGSCGALGAVGSSGPGILALFEGPKEAQIAPKSILRLSGEAMLRSI